jgi:hypothetical protein
MTRTCGDCQLCCRLLPMKAGSSTDRPELRTMLGNPHAIVEFDKPAGAYCPLQKHHKGCKHYAIRPISCRMWSCRWLVGDDTAAMRRPDRAGYVIDLVPDFVLAEPHDGTEPTRIQVVQVWVDPKMPEAWRQDDELLAYLDRQGRKGIAALIRLNARDGITLIPPSMNASGKFLEFRGPATMREFETWPTTPKGQP